jgi:hypothetical protein
MALRGAGGGLFGTSNAYCGETLGSNKGEGLMFHKQFFLERCTQLVSTSKNQQVAISITAGFLERLSLPRRPSTLGRSKIAKAGD